MIRLSSEVQTSIYHSGLRISSLAQPIAMLRPLVGDTASFSRFQLSSEVQSSIYQSGLRVPTLAQLGAIPRLMLGENLLLISQTGRGKTLAYLIPVIEKLQRTNSECLYPVANKPRAIVIVPTRELAVQVLSVVRRVFGSSVSSGGLAPGLLSFVKERRLLASPGLDLIVTTPSRLQLHMKHGSVRLSEVEFLVVDEADTLCDSVYEKEVVGVVRKVSSKCQFAVVGATRTAAVNNFVSTVLPELTPVVTSDAHLLVPHLDQVFVPVGRRKRTSCLSEVLTEPDRLGGKTLIFTNSVRTCNFLSRWLTENPLPGVASTSFHGSMPYRVRSGNYKKFSTDPLTNVLVCTNLASRGLDLDSVSHVVMYDFPHTIADYLHRAGRTARAGRLGRVTALVTGRNAAVAKQIQEAAKSGKPIQHRTTPVRRIVALDKYKSALSEFRNRTRGSNPGKLRAVLGPHVGIGSPARKAVATEWKRTERGKADLAFLQKRKRLSKKEALPQLPDRRVERSEARETTQLTKHGNHVRLVVRPRDHARAKTPKRRIR